MRERAPKTGPDTTGATDVTVAIETTVAAETTAATETETIGASDVTGATETEGSANVPYVSLRAYRGMALWLAVLALQMVGCEEAAPETGGTVEMFSWWTNPGEAEALGALLDLYAQEHPGVEVLNAAVEDSAIARATLETRFAQGYPPDTFQANGGYDLTRWVADTGAAVGQRKIDDLSGFFEEHDLTERIPPPVVGAVSFAGVPYAVPLNIHRNNSLFFNRQVLAAHNLQPPTTIVEFLDACETLRVESSLPCLSAGGAEPWTLRLLVWENLLVATAGAAYYTDFFAGRADPRDPELEAVVDNLLALWEYADPAAMETGMEAAVLRMSDGTAAFNVMGDWAKAILQQSGKVADVDFGQVAFPGTVGTFVFVTDSFPLALGGPAREPTIDLLALMASTQGQETFNVLKGSIPALLDASTVNFDPLGQRMFVEFREAEAWLMGNIAPTTFDLGPHISETLRLGKREILLNAISNYYDIILDAN